MADRDKRNSDPELREFEDLIVRHHRGVLAFASALTAGSAVAPDLAQDAFVTAYSQFSRFDRRRSFPAWIRGIVRNKYREWCRRQRLVPVADEVIEHVAAIHTSWEQSDTKSDSPFQALEACLGKLPSVLKQAVDLFYLKGLSGAVVAEKLKTAPATIRKRLQRAREALAGCIRSEMETDQ